MAPHERREDLIRTALGVFALRPPGEVTPEDIAEAADVSRALVYRYFPNMARLRREALEQAMSELLERLVPPAGLPPREQLRGSLVRFVEFADSYSPAYVALLRGGSVIATEETEAEIDRVRTGVLELLLDRVGPRPPSPPVLMALRCWISVVETAVMLWLRERGRTAEELADWLLDQLVAMVLAAGAPEEGLSALTSRG
ncbi:TetR/AcrR family transcriptional regulator [Nocardiopsis changdeensis]|uniref:TetR/AcrR family transcriptional regulator n=1 Tax=Nocardiopsis changdeensis TaxID=2831969 RepID=A0ABX8BNC7_9ACTN|nr:MULTISPECIES: TetR/AcrR family transcriptional regulator [Nocardiopsis]QUX21908.1 TetR/AcrR family transcriptional regulator [Nocardiopsis changdeensis]QYX37842.1 TetR/AcrR family transcriptional regulator [Nocardiopsis sp. MT53]